MLRTLTISFAAAVLLAACASEPDAGSSEEDSAPTEMASVRVLSEAEVVRGDRRRLLADLLYEGLQALDADRLLTPVDDNAHARFQRVLAYDPDNELARQGLEDIVLRYVALAREATYQGLFDQAELLLDRARFVNDQHPAIAPAQAAIEQEKNSGDLFFEFEARAVVSRSDSLQQQLADIARQARAHGAFFLITAPSDEHARWMHSIMREAVSGYRLRGNIELAGRYSIRLRMPAAEDNT